MNMNEKQTILIVDDSKFNRDILKEILGETYHYLEAENGNQAIQLVGDNLGIDLMLLDIYMPQMDGFEVLEMMNKGLVDIGLFLEPVNTQGLDYIRMPENDHWVVTMRPDDPLAEKEVITKNDLLDVPLILPERTGARSLLANRFGKDFHRLHVAYTSNLGTNAGILASKGAGYPVSLEGAGRYWREDLLIQKRLYPESTSNTVVAWRRNIPNSPVVNKLIEEIKAFDGWKN